MKKVILNIGCGKTRIPDSIGVDRVKIDDYVDILHDLNVTPYPFSSDYADEIHMYHVLEHLNFPIQKIEEMHRILKPGGILHIRVPHFSSMGAFTDITHVRPFGYYSFDPFQKDHDQHFYTTTSFKIINREIKYFGLFPNSGDYEKYIHKNQCPVMLKPFVIILNKIINFSPMLFERLWCYWVGGAIELVIDLQKENQ
ncbi:methyltransferase domain-containing protein [candidate division WWE3 bacterium]|nr:methyltransferase domain-containing protein [candidate division WWE3 bacterium]